MNDLQEARKLDQEHRKHGTNTGLFSFEDLQKGKVWDFSYPTLVFDDNDNHRIKRARDGPMNFLPDTLGDFHGLWNQKYQALADKFTYDNYIVAGGCLANLLRNWRENMADDYYGNDGPVIDIDIFFYDCTPEEAIETIRKMADSFGRENIVSFIRSDLAMTMILDHNKLGGDEGRYGRSSPLRIQFIFRIYSSISEILHGFDLPSSAVGFDGEKLYFTANSKFAYEYGLNYVDTTRRSTTYEWRINKYFNRGFDLVLPNLRVDPPKTINKGTNWTINLEFLEIDVRCCSNCQPNRYGGGFMGGRANKDTGSKPCDCTYLKNPNHLTGYLCKKNAGSDNYNRRWRLDRDTWRSEPSDYWDIVIENEASYGSFHWLVMIMSQNLKKLLNNSFEESGRNKIIIINPDIEGIMNNHLGMTSYIRKKFQRVGYAIPDEVRGPIVDDMIQNLTQRSLQAMENFNQTHEKGIEFITTNPGTQLTSSFNPIMEQAWKWYGMENYIPDNEMRQTLHIGNQDDPLIAAMMNMNLQDQAEKPKGKIIEVGNSLACGHCQSTNIQIEANEGKISFSCQLCGKTSIIS